MDERSNWLPGADGNAWGGWLTRLRRGVWRERLSPVALLLLLLIYQVVTATSGTELCFTSLGPGAAILGVVPGGTPRTWTADVFNVTVAGVEQQAFCTDINNPIRQGQCYQQSSLGVTDPLVACTLQSYPPASTLSNEEAAARQAAVWHFADGFTLLDQSPTSPEVMQRYTAILADINTQAENGTCAALLAPSIAIDPPDAVTFLTPDGGNGYLPGTQTYTITVRQGTQPRANQPVTVSTDYGILNDVGSTVTVQTNAQGQAGVTLAQNMPGVATLTAATTLRLPVGTRIDPGATIQKLVLSGSQAFTFSATATSQWEPGAGLVIKKFHDRNRDGVFNGTEALIDWTISYREEGSSSFTAAALGEDGTLTLTVNPAATYEVCETIHSSWEPTTPTCYSGVTPGTTVWFGNVQVPALLIQKYHDLNGNAERDPGEPGLDGWGFQLDRLDPADGRWKQSYSGVTANAGLLGYSDVALFRYRVEEQAQAGWYASTPALQTVDVSAAERYTVTFGNLQPGAVQVEKIWQTSGEPVDPPVTPATICLKRTGPGTPAQNLLPTDSAGAALTATTEGYYCQDVTSTATWSNLWPGTYTLKEFAPSGWEPVTPHSNVTVTSGQVQPVTIVNRSIPEDPTAVTLVSFTATVNQNEVILNWETAAEIDNAGFDLYRATAATGPWSRINPALIPAEGNLFTGANYRLVDQPGAGQFFYLLEDIDRYGERTAHGPVVVQVGPMANSATPRVYLPLMVSP